MASRNYETLIELCEKHMRLARGRQAAQVLFQLPVHKLPRKYRLPFARIARRLNLPAQGLRILDAIINPDKNKLEAQLSDQERAEYGILLYQAGSVDEGLRELSHVKSEGRPEAALYSAFCHIKQWDDEKACERLAEYLSLPGLTDYQIAVAELNLAAQSLLRKPVDEAHENLLHLRERFREKNYSRLYSNVLELLAQLLIRNGK